MNWKIICMIMNFVGVVEAHDLVKFAWITANIWEPWLQLGSSYARISDQRHPIMNGILLHKFAFDTHCRQLLAAQLDNSPNLGTYFIDGRGRYNLQKEIWKICGHIAGIPTQLVCMELEFQLVTMDWNVNTVEFEEARKGLYIFLNFVQWEVSLSPDELMQVPCHVLNSGYVSWSNK